MLKEKATIIVIGNKFTRSVYHAKVLTSVFGDYYLPEEEEENNASKDSVKAVNAKQKTGTPQIRKPKKDLKGKKDSS
ncbi:MAG: hypothetical protein IPI88_03445 [Chitinophagaceae bacterium]|nr:hypothetical protein [Chitinophagaceae bacterium]